MPEARERESGLDVLRIVAMFFIVVLHVLGQGGILRGAAPLSWGYRGAWLLEAGALCAVNCYGLISGYFGVSAGFRYRKYLPHWFQVLFYSLGGTLLFFLATGAAPGPGEIWRAFTPVIHGQYWYFTAYTVVFFLTPFLNRGLEHINAQEGRNLCLSLFVLFCALPTLIFQDPFVLKYGYSALWLIALYLMGGCIRKFGVKKLLPPLGYLGVYLVSVVCAWGGMQWWVARALARTGELPPGDPFLQYVSPLIFVAGLALFLCCRDLKIRNRAVLGAIGFLAPVSFGVYLIHTNPYFFNGVLRDCMVPLLTRPAPVYLAAALGLSLGIYIVCSLIDSVRLRLFALVAAALKRKE